MAQAPLPPAPLTGSNMAQGGSEMGPRGRKVNPESWKMGSRGGKMASGRWTRGWVGWEIGIGGKKMVHGDWKMVLGYCKMDLLAGNLHFSLVFGGSGPETYIFRRCFEGSGRRPAGGSKAKQC